VILVLLGLPKKVNKI